jgi:hypothetical protein
LGFSKYWSLQPIVKKKAIKIKSVFLFMILILYI